MFNAAPRRRQHSHGFARLPSLLNLGFVIAEDDLRETIAALHREFFSELDDALSLSGVRPSMPDGYRLAVCGYGKMGKLVEKFAPEFGFTVACTIDETESSGDFQGLDVAVDFSVPSAVHENVAKFASLGVNMVIKGTTGWLDRFDA